MQADLEDATPGKRIRRWICRGVPLLLTAQLAEGGNTHTPWDQETSCVLKLQKTPWFEGDGKPPPFLKSEPPGREADWKQD